MRVQIRQLSKQKECQSNVQEDRIGLGRGRCGVRTEDPVCDIKAGQDPVVGAVLEDVAGGHRGIAEAMDENRFELAFQEVDGQKTADQ